MKRIICLMVFIGCSFALSGKGKNLIRNGSFENGKYPSGVPREWHQENDNAYCPVAEFVTDAHNGKFAVVLKNPTQWVYRRPQYIWQRVPVQSGRNYTFSGNFKGFGIIYLYGQPLTKKGKPIGAAFERKIAISEYYTKYNLSISIPDKATWIELRTGIAKAHTTMAIDDLSLKLMNNTNDAIKEKVISNSKILYNIASFAKVTAMPPSKPYFDNSSNQYTFGIESLKSLTDGDPFTHPTYECCAERVVQLTFRYSTTVHIEKIRLFSGKLKSYIIRGDIHGKGNFNKIMFRENFIDDGWHDAKINTNVFAVRIDGTEGLLGYRGSRNELIKEVEILTPDKKTLSLLDNMRKNDERKRIKVESNMTLERISTPSKDLFVKDELTFKKGVCVESWMYGWGKPNRNFKYQGNPPFDNFVKNLKKLHVNYVWFFAPTWDHNFLSEYYTGGTEYYRTPIFPSEYVDSMNYDALSPLNNALHQAGFKTIGMLFYSLPPAYDSELFFYPVEETSRYPERKQRPSIIFGGHFEKTQAGLLKEMMKYGCDGVGVCGDETYYKGHFLKTIPANAADVKVFKDAYKTDIPKEEGDTLKYRQWINMRQKGLGTLWRNIVGDVKKAYPNAITMANFMIPSMNSNLEEQGIDFPLLKDAGIEGLGSDYVGSFSMKYIVSSNGWRNAHNLGYGTDPRRSKEIQNRQRPIKQSGEIIRGLNYGLNGWCVYRYNYILMNKNVTKGVVDGYALAEDLEKAGIMEAKIPESVALLYLRNSEDWYQAKVWYGKGYSPYEDRAIEGIRGFVAHRQVGNLLIENGIPFEIVFMDRHKIKSLKKYKTMLLPFPYALSKKNADLIDNALQNGNTLIVFERKGEMDEWGESHDEPFLDKWMKKYPSQVTYFPESLYDMNEKYKRKVVDVLRKSPKSIPMIMDSDGARVEAFLLENQKENRYFLSVVNWERRKVSCAIDLNLKPGAYDITLRDENGFNRVILNGKRISLASDLAKLTLELDPGRFKVFIMTKR